MKQLRERPILFRCTGQTAVGILHLCQEPAKRGVLIVVGGPQYRVGSHRQFVLLARHLAQSGYPVFRFDHVGIGDSPGDSEGFEHIHTDIAAAVDTFMEQMPGLEEIVIWGLCDAASAALFYAYTDQRIAGLVLANPWVRTEAGIAESYLKRYYLSRVASADFWRKLIRGELHVVRALRSFAAMLRNAVAGRLRRIGQAPGAEPYGDGCKPLPNLTLPERMLTGMERFQGRTLFILSGEDLTAGEFVDCVNRSAGWKNVFGQAAVKQCQIDEADHTFSRRAWRDTVSRWTEEWLGSW